MCEEHLLDFLLKMQQPHDPFHSWRSRRAVLDKETHLEGVEPPVLLLQRGVTNRSLNNERHSFNRSCKTYVSTEAVVLGKSQMQFETIACVFH
ncbi:predicted protein [Botrytis cinerea T4]|uniref:Uncharacterized protein n=1 Tax=Botryotinia fuckeliana (strain T4) TaxID=999810 RepID=G2XP58_BOTF4|nr:predicted protein [Botrytis cinerea T4]